MNMHEFLSFNKSTSGKEVVERIQTHYGAWLEQLHQQVCQESCAFGKTLSVEIFVDGQPVSAGYDAKGIRETLRMLTEARSFSIDVSGEELDEAEEVGVLYAFLDEIKEKEDITYKFASFSSKFTEFKSGYIANGKSGNLLDEAEEKCVQGEELLWYSWSCDLSVEFDLEKYGDVADRLHDAVRRHLPADQVRVAEAVWSGEVAEQGYLLPDVQWVTSDLKEIAVFLNEINDILISLDGNYEIKADGLWFDLAHFAAAEWIVSDKVVKLVSARH